MSKPSRLPARMPYGTKYVLENDGAIVRRFVEFFTANIRNKYTRALTREP